MFSLTNIRVGGGLDSCSELAIGIDTRQGLYHEVNRDLTLS